MPEMPITYIWAARAEAVTRNGGEIENLPRRPKTKLSLFWRDKKGRCSITL